jgi:hypothetical protein
MTGTAADSTSEFRRARGALLARMRRDARLSPIARLVGWEIAMLLNPEQGGYAWPSHEHLKDQLGIGDSSVKRAVAELERYQYYEVERRQTREGRKNYYRAPDLAEAKVGTNPGLKVGTKNEGGRDQFGPYLGSKNVPILSSMESSMNQRESQHHHHHQNRHSKDEIAAELTNELMRLAAVKMRAEPAFVQQELAKVHSWLDRGWNREAIVHSVQLQMARRRHSSASGPIHTIGYFERELAKVFAAMRPTGS